MPVSPAYPAHSNNARASSDLLRQIEQRQFRLLTEQVRAGTWAGAAVILMILLLAPQVANSRWLVTVALLRMAMYLHENMLARTLQTETLNRHPRASLQFRLVVSVGIANLIWGALTWPLVFDATIGFMTFLLTVIALFSICLSTLSASLHPKTLAASALGGCLGLAPKIYALSATIGLLLPLGFLIYCVTIFYFARFLGRQTRGGIVLDIRRKRIARQLNRTNQALKMTLAEARRLADQDGLTLLRNRRAFEQQLPRFTSDWPDRECLLMLIDVDHFKRINDRFGHAMGDGVLVALGSTLTQWEVEADARLTGRWGGEEFIAVVAIDPTEQPGEMANALRARIEELAEGLHWPGAMDLSASIGCAWLDSPDQFDVALRQADAALYAAKNAGRNCWKLAA